VNFLESTRYFTSQPLRCSSTAHSSPPLRRNGSIASNTVKSAEFDNPHQFPERAIRFCLNYAGLTAGDIDHMAYSFNPELRRTQYRAEWWDPRLEETFRLRLVRCAVLPRSFLDVRFGKGFISCPTIWHMRLRRISRQASIARPSSPSTGSAR